MRDASNERLNEGIIDDGESLLDTFKQELNKAHQNRTLSEQIPLEEN